MRSRIHEAALRVVHRKGLVSMSMGDLIAESGLSAGAIYVYYRSKDDIVEAVAAEVLGGRVADIARLGDLDPLPEPAEVVGLFLRTLPTELVDFGLLLEVWAYAARSGRLHSYTAAAYDGLRGAFRDYLAAYAARAGVPTDAASDWGWRTAPVLMSLCQAGIAQRSMIGPDRIEVLLEALASVRFVLPETVDSPG